MNPMNPLSEKLLSLADAVPDAPGFAESVARRLPASSGGAPPARRAGRGRFLSRPGALAAAVLAVLLAAAAALVMAGSPGRAFADVVRRVDAVESVRYRCWMEPDDRAPARPVVVEYRTAGSVGRRTELVGGGSGRAVFVHDAHGSPDTDLWLYPDRKVAQVTLADQGRDALSAGSPAEELKRFASTGVRAAAGETYRGKAVRVFVSERPEQIDGGRQTRTLRVLVDEATGLPVRIEVDGDMTPVGQGRYRMVMDGFEWNPPLTDQTFSSRPPEGFRVTYDLIRPLTHGLSAYAQVFDGRLPDRVGPDALGQLRQRLDAERAQGKPARPGVELDAGWGFAVPAFAAKHHIDFRYYGAGKTVGRDSAPEIVAAVETAPGSGTYDVWRSDSTFSREDRSRLP